MFLTLEIAFPTGCLLDHPSEPQSKCITPYSASNQLFLIFKIVNRFRHFSYPTKQQSITVHWEFKGFVSSRKLKGSRGTNVCLALTHVPTEPSCWQFCAQTLWKTSGQLLNVLSWSLRDTTSTISVCRSIFLYATLQHLPKPFDPFAQAPEAARYWSDNGPEWFSWLPLRRELLALKHIQWRWVNSQVLAFPLLFSDFVLFVSDKKWMSF